MNCKRRGLAHERIDHLSAEALRKSLVVDAVGVGELIVRHIKSAEQNIPDGKSAGEIHRTAAVGGGMVPTMKYRAGEDVAERPKRPIQIGVYEGRGRGGEWTDPEHHVR